MTDAERLDRIRHLEQKIAELRARLPKHSPPTAMLVELDEMEDELERLAGKPMNADMSTGLR